MATSYLSPGVYIEEVDRGSKPIEAVGTSTAAFIGESSVGPTNEAVLITNWAQYTPAICEIAVWCDARNAPMSFVGGSDCCRVPYNLLTAVLLAGTPVITDNALLTCAKFFTPSVDGGTAG